MIARTYKTYFISGHRDLTQEEFDKYYKPRIEQVLWENYDDIPFPSRGIQFVVGDYEGCDIMAQEYLLEKIKSNNKPWWLTYKNVRVYHMGNLPNHIASYDFDTKGEFSTDEERDMAMTKDSDDDIAFVRKGKRDSGTAQNLIRRHEF